MVVHLTRIPPLPPSYSAQAHATGSHRRWVSDKAREYSSYSVHTPISATHSYTTVHEHGRHKHYYSLPLVSGPPTQLSTDKLSLPTRLHPLCATEHEHTEGTLPVHTHSAVLLAASLLLQGTGFSSPSVSAWTCTVVTYLTQKETVHTA